MDYTRSAQIRSKSLAELVFEQDRTVREAMSDKFKARMMGIKEKFTPLNFVRMLTGSGTIGRSIRTVAGRAMGYTERDIERFGGYKRKRSIYGPDRSRVPAGSKTPVKVNDSTADILAKIYNLMRKIDEDNTRRYEEEQNYTEENQLEGRKRHEKLLESLGMKKKGTSTTKTYTPEKPKEEEEDKSSSILGKIFSSIFGVFGKTFKIMASLGGIIVSAVTGLFGMIKSLMGMAKTIISTIMKLVVEMIEPLIEGLFKSIVKFITKVLPEFATGLIRLITGVSTAMEDLFKVVREILDNSFVAAILGKRAAIASAILTTAYAVYQLNKNPPDEETQRKQDEDLYIGKEAINDYNESNKYQNKAVAADVPVEYRKQYAESARIFKESADAKASEYQATLASSLNELGFSFQGYDKNNLPIFRDKNGNIPLREDLISARSVGKTLGENSFTKGIFDKINPMKSESYHKSLDMIHDETNRITNIGEQFKTMMDKVINIPSQMAEEGTSYIKDALAQAGDFISHITGPTEQTIAMPAVRNTEKTFQERIRAITYVV
jgi:hypothetical protein